MENQGPQLGARGVSGQSTTTSFDGILRSTAAADTNALSDEAVISSTPIAPEHVVLNDRPGWRIVTSKLGISIMVALVLIASVVTLVQRANRPVVVEGGKFDSLQLPLGTVAGEETLPLGTAQTLLVNGQLKVSNSVVLSPSEQPTNPLAGQLYFDEVTNQMAYYNGSEFMNVGGTTIVQNTTNVTTAGSGGGLTAVGGTANTIPKFTGSQRLGNSIITDDGATVTVGGDLNLASASAAPLSDLMLWPDNPTPTIPADPGDDEAVEIGVKFNTDVSGFIKGIRFYKGTINTGTHIGNLWSSNGALLATATFANETADGWQEVRFSTPVAVAAETTYVASYFAPDGHYAVDTNYFTSGGVDNGSLHALRHGADGGNGVFRYNATSAFPTQGFGGANYWVDVIFAPNPAPPRLRMNGVQIASSDLSNNGELAKRGASQVFTGNNTFRSSSDSTSSFSIQNASGEQMFTVDTANQRLYVGTISPGDTVGVLLVLSNRINLDDPPGVEGAMYYNRAERQFRCYRDGVWSSCGTLDTSFGFEQYDDFMGGQTTSFTGNDIGQLGWHAAAIGANGVLDYNPSTPTPDATRPGILWLQTPAVANQGTTFILGNGGNGSMLIAKDNIVRTAVAVGATTNQVVRIGLHNQTTATTQPLSGVWWEADPAASTFWRHCRGDGATATCGVSSIPITADTWVRLEIRVTSTGAGVSSAVFIINDITYNITTVTIDSTNRVSPAFSCYTTTGTAQNCYWDYFQLKGTGATVR
jgi:hypothetical protein